MNFRVRMFVESAVTVISLFQETTRLFETRVKIKLRDTPSAKGYAAKSSQSSIVLLGNRGTLQKNKILAFYRNRCKKS